MNVVDAIRRRGHRELSCATTEESQRWFTRARKVLAGGVSSSARSISTTEEMPYPLYITHGRGSHIWDADGNGFVDYLLSYGSLLLGHTDADVVAAVGAQLDLGTMFGTCNTVEVELAEQICRMVPCAQLVRFANSGSEAMCGAVRAARGYTGRNKLVKFEGHYHGWIDLLAVSSRPSLSSAGPPDQPRSCAHSPGIPPSVVQDVLVAPWNNREAVTAILDRHEGEIAAFIAEPIAANNACTMPADGFLQFLRDQCTKRGIVLIFDEIVTGFRVQPGGAQELFGVVPDLAVFSKALGGGMPISAFAGSDAIMEPVGANIVKHGGTYNGNPLCAAAALVVLQKVQRQGVCEHAAHAGQTLINAIRNIARRQGVSCTVQGVGSMFQVIFGVDRPLMNYRDLAHCDSRRYGAFREALLRTGIHANGSGSACWFVSLAHTADDVKTTIGAIESAMTRIASC